MSEKARHLVVDPSRCTGHARCFASAPELFSFDSEEERSSAKPGPVPHGLLDKARAAVGGCPEGAIRFVSDQADG